MKQPRRYAVTAVSGLACCLLLVACTSTPPTQAGNPAGPTGVAPSATAGSSAAPTGTASAARSPGSPRAAVAGTEACSLVTRKDVTRTIGTDPGPGTADSRHGATQCAYGSFPHQVLLVNNLPTHGVAAYRHLRGNVTRSNGGQLHVTNVAGLGDQAFELSGLHADAIYFTSGDALITIGLTTPGSPPNGAARTLATIAAGRL